MNSSHVPPHKLKSDSSILAKTVNTLEQLVCTAIEKKDAPGISVALFDKDTIHLSKGFGLRRLEYNEPMTSSTLFQMASVSKPICATALAILQKKGLCSLSDHPRQYLNNLFQGDSYKALKIEHLLNHSSGIPYDGFEDRLSLMYLVSKFWRNWQNLLYHTNPEQTLNIIM